MHRRTFLRGLVAGSLGGGASAAAQPAVKTYRVGVILEGGSYYAAIDGFKAGLKELGFEEGRQYTLLIRDVKGNLGAVAETARNLEQEKVDLIFAMATSVSLAVRQGQRRFPSCSPRGAMSSGRV